MDARSYLNFAYENVRTPPQRPWQRAITALEKTIAAHATRTAIIGGAAIGCSSLAIAEASTPVAILVTTLAAAIFANPILEEAYNRFDVASQFQDKENYHGRAKSLLDVVVRTRRFAIDALHFA